MKKLILVLITLSFINCNSQQPTQFSEKAMKNMLFSLTDESLTLGKVIQQYKGKKVLIDVWASWCADCIRGLPRVKELQQAFPDVVFLFLSVDKKNIAWKRGIQRFKIEGEHYLVENGFDSELGDFLNLNWIPRYVVLDETGSIRLFKATKSSDKAILEALKK